MAIFWVGFNLPSGALDTSWRCYENQETIAVIPRSNSGVAGNTFNGYVKNSAGAIVSPTALYDTATGTTYPSVPAGGEFCIQAVTSGALDSNGNGVFGFTLEMPERQQQIITFNLPDIARTETIDLRITRNATDATRASAVSTVGLQVGASVEGEGIPSGTTITQILSLTDLRVSNALAAGDFDATFTRVFTSPATVDDLFKNADSLVPGVLLDPPLYVPNPVPLSASSNSGLTAFTFTSSDPTRASIAGNVLSYPPSQQTNFPLAATITAFQAGNANWKPASKNLILDPNAVSPVQHFLTLTIPSNLAVGEEQLFTVGSSQNLSPIVIESLNIGIADFVGNGTAVIDGVPVKTWNPSTKIKGFSFGSTVVKAFQGGTSTIEPAEVIEPVTVGKLNQTITFTVPVVDWQIGTVFDFTGYVFSSSGLPIQLSTSNDTIAEFEGKVLTIKNQGSVNLIAFQEGDEEWAPASATRNIGIGSSGQTIVFEEFGNVFFGAAFNPRVYATSGLPVTLASSNTSVATVTGGVLQVIGVGAATITATQAGDAFWTAAQVQSRLLTVQKGVPLISAVIPPRLQVGTENRVEVFGSASNAAAVVFSTSPPFSVVLENGKWFLSASAEGTGHVTAAVAETNFFTAASARYRVEVGKEPQTISGTLFHIFGFPAFVDLDLRASTGLPLSYALSGPGSLNGTRVSATGVGTISVVATQNGDSRFLAAPPATVRIVIERGVQSVSFPAINPIPLGQNQNLAASVPGGTIQFYSSNPAIVSVSGAVATAISAGTAFILAVTQGDVNYYPAAAVQPVSVLVPRTDSVTLPSGVSDIETFNSVSQSTAHSGQIVVAPPASTQDVEAFDSKLQSAATTAPAATLASGARDEESFNPLVVSPAFQGVSFDMRGFLPGGDETAYGPPAASPVFTGSNFLIPVSTGDASPYESSVPSPDADGGCASAKYDGKDGFEVYNAAPELPAGGYVLQISGGTTGYLLWKTGGKYKL
jgi:hypothetical protein